MTEPQSSLTEGDGNCRGGGDISDDDGGWHSDGEVEKQWTWQWMAALMVDAAIDGGDVIGCCSGEDGGESSEIFDYSVEPGSHSVETLAFGYCRVSINLDSKLPSGYDN